MAYLVFRNPIYIKSYEIIKIICNALIKRISIELKKFKGNFKNTRIYIIGIFTTILVIYISYNELYMYGIRN